MSLTGQRVAHYSVGDELNRGGMGVIYRATDTRLGRTVALKVLGEAMAADPEARDRFLREARAASALEHPGIAVIYDVGQDAGVDYIAMELVAGPSLAAQIEHGPIPLDRALTTAVEIGEALAHAHAHGIVHRDLKPANVLVTREGRVKVIDFGLAKRLVPGSMDEGTVLATAPGVLLGTAAYMAPEQARGATVDTRSDIFSFGVLLYELLAGVRPFRGQSSVDLLDSVLNRPAPALPVHGLAPTSPVSLELNRIVAKCLEKDPAARYQGMADVLVDLRAARARLAAPPASDASAVSAGASRNPASSNAPRRGRLIAVAAAALLLGLGGYGLWARNASQTIVTAEGSRPAVAVLYFENNTGSPDLDWLRTGLTDMLVTDLSQSPDVEVLSTDRLAQIMRDLGRGDDRVVSADLVQEVARRARVQRVLIGSYVKAGDAIRINLKLQEPRTGHILNSERVDAASEAALFPTVDQLTARLKQWLAPPAPVTQLFKPPAVALGDAPVKLDAPLKDVTTASVEAFRLYAQGHDLHSRSREEEALPLMQQAVAIDPDFALAYAKLGVITGNLGRTSERNRYVKEALARLDRLPESERLYVEAFASSFTPESIPAALEIYERLLAKYPGHAAARNNAAALYLVFEDYDKATRHYRLLFDAGFEFAGVADGLADGYLSLGRPDEALAIYDEFIRRYPAEPLGYAGRGKVLMLTGKLEEARAAFERALALGPGLRLAFGGLAGTAILQENWDAALRVAKEMERSRNPITSAAGFKVEGLVNVYRGHGAEALRLYERAAALTGGPDGTASSAETRAWMAETLLARRQYKEALVAAERGISDAHGNPPRFPNMMAKAVAAAALKQPEMAAAIIAGFDDAAARSHAARVRRFATIVRGRVALAAGDQERALADLTAAEAAAPPGGTPTLFWNVAEFQPIIWHALGRLHYDAGRLDQARAYFDKVATVGARRLLTPAQFVESLFYLARIAERQNDAVRAREYDAKFLSYWGSGDMHPEPGRARPTTD